MDDIDRKCDDYQTFFNIVYGKFSHDLANHQRDGYFSCFIAAENGNPCYKVDKIDKMREKIKKNIHEGLLVLSKKHSGTIKNELNDLIFQLKDAVSSSEFSRIIENAFEIVRRT